MMIRMPAQRTKIWKRSRFRFRSAVYAFPQSSAFCFRIVATTCNRPVKCPQRFSFVRLLVRKLVPVAHVSRFRNTSSDVVVQLPSCEAQVSNAVPVKIRLRQNCSLKAVTHLCKCAEYIRNMLSARNTFRSFCHEEEPFAPIL